MIANSNDGLISVKQDAAQSSESIMTSAVGTMTDNEVIALANTMADTEIAPHVAAYEDRKEFPRKILASLGRAGLLSVPFPENCGGLGRTLEIYVQVIEALAARWLTIAQSVSVHTLACYPVLMHGSASLRAEYLPGLLDGTLLGANCLSEAHAGSDAASLSVRAERTAEGYVIRGEKAWSTHAGLADFYSTYCRTGGTGARGISCFFVEANISGVCPQRPKVKMAFHCTPTAPVHFSDAKVPANHLIGREGRGFLIAMETLDWGRLAIAACAVGVAQAALTYATAFAKARIQFGKPIIEFQGIGFQLADMATGVAAARALLLAAARRCDRGEPYSIDAAKAKLFATDMAMKATLDAVQILGGYGYTGEHPVERWMREAKLLQIVEGTNEIQRAVISRAL